MMDSFQSAKQINKLSAGGTGKGGDQQKTDWEKVRGGITSLAETHTVIVSLTFYSKTLRSFIFYLNSSLF